MNKESKLDIWLKQIPSKIQEPKQEGVFLKWEKEDCILSLKSLGDNILMIFRSETESFNKIFKLSNLLDNSLKEKLLENFLI